MMNVEELSLPNLASRLFLPLAASLEGEQHPLEPGPPPGARKKSGIHRGWQ